MVPDADDAGVPDSGVCEPLPVVMCPNGFVGLPFDGSLFADLQSIDRDANETQHLGEFEVPLDASGDAAAQPEDAARTDIVEADIAKDAAQLDGGSE